MFLDGKLEKLKSSERGIEDISDMSLGLLLIIWYVLFSGFRIFDHINIVQFCDALKMLKEGHYIHNIHLSDDLYNPVRKNKVKNESGPIPVPLLMRNCQLLHFKNNREYQIFVTSFPAIEHYSNGFVQNTTLVMECWASECDIVAMATSYDFAREFPAFGMTSVEYYFSL